MTKNRENRVQGVIFDWAGTTVDYGSLAPVGAMVRVFESRGVDVSPTDVRRFMGLHKRDHLAGLLHSEAVQSQWVEANGRPSGEDDLDEMYGELEFTLEEILPQYSDPLPGVVALAQELRSVGLRIGSCTGYTRPMMDILRPAAAAKGYEPDVVVTPDAVPAGRPAPFMCWENAVRLGVYPLHALVKVGDTLADIEEGRNAGMWSVGVVLGGSELGLSQTEMRESDPEALDAKVAEVSDRLFEAGAHDVIHSLGELEAVIEDVNRRLEAGERPSDVGLRKGEAR